MKIIKKPRLLTKVLLNGEKNNAILDEEMKRERGGEKKKRIVHRFTIVRYHRSDDGKWHWIVFECGSWFIAFIISQKGIGLEKVPAKLEVKHILSHRFGQS